MTKGAPAYFSITSSDVQRMAGDLARTASQPDFLAMIQEVQQAPAAQKVSVARSVATVEEVASRRILVPETFRITTRSFEDPAILSGEADELDAPTVAFNHHGGTVAHHGKVVTVMERRGVVPGPISTEVVADEIRRGVEEIGVFVASPAFQAVLTTLAALDEDDRPRFVLETLLDPAEQARRGLQVPDGMCIQRSEFADQRPTLFCVTKVLPLAYPWHKVTITFDNP